MIIKGYNNNFGENVDYEVKYEEIISDKNINENIQIGTKLYIFSIRDTKNNKYYECVKVTKEYIEEIGIENYVYNNICNWKSNYEDAILKNTNYSNLTNNELYIQYQQAKINFRNAIEGTQEEIEADRIFTELSKEVESREDFDFLSYKLAETEIKKQNELKVELLQGLTNQIESLEDGGTINLIDLIEDEGVEATEELLIYLYDNAKHLNIKSHEVVNNICTSIKVFSR